MLYQFLQIKKHLEKNQSPRLLLKSKSLLILMMHQWMVRTLMFC